jgi:hypothetical protein
MTWPFATRQDLNLRRMISRMLKAARFNGDTFRELRDDSSATVQSVSLVAIIGLCYGAGLGFFGFFVTGISLLDAFTIVLIGLFSAVIIAFVWSGTTETLPANNWLLGARASLFFLMGTRASVHPNV